MTKALGNERQQKQLRKNRQILQLLKRSGGGEMIWTRLTDGQRKTQGQGRERDEICNWEEMPAEKSSLTECEASARSRRRDHLDPFARIGKGGRSVGPIRILRRHSTVVSR